MKKNSGAKKRKSRHSRKLVRSEAGPRLVKPPILDLPLESRLRIVTEVGRQARQAFATHLERVLQVVGQVEPLHALSVLSCYGLMKTRSKAGLAGGLSENTDVLPSHPELLQAMVLRLAPDQVPTTAASPQVMQELFELLPLMTTNYHRMDLGVSAPVSEEQGDLQALQRFLRTHTQAVRNWSFFGKMVRTASDLLQPLEQPFRRRFGLSGVEFVQLCAHLCRRMEDKVNEFREKQHRVFHALTINDAIDLHCELFEGGHPAIAAKLAESARSQGAKRDSVRAFLLTRSEVALPSALTFSASDIASELALPEGAVGEVLRRLALEQGDLSDRSAQSFFLDNPVWTHPLIARADGGFFCAVPQILLSFFFPILEGLAAGDEDLRKRLSDRRARYLEDETERLLLQHLPAAQVVRGFKWTVGTSRFESDLIVRIDSLVILIEAKSGRVSRPALRGALDRAKQHVKNLLLDPSLQSQRLADWLLEVARSPDAGSQAVHGLPFSLADVRKVIRLSVALEDFATLQSNSLLLQRAGWIPEGHRLAPCLLVTDLQIVFDLLQPAYVALHYLQRRAELQLRFQQVGDELDLLGLYLDTGLNLGTAGGTDNTFVITGYSARIDQYYSMQDEALMAKPPRRRISRWFETTCNAVAERAFTGWTEVLYVLLSMRPNDQMSMEAELHRIQKRVMSKAGSKESDTVVFVFTTAQPQALLVHVFRDAGPEERRARLDNLVANAFEHQHVERCLAIAIRASDVEPPFSTLAMYWRDSVDPKTIEVH